MSIVLGIAGGSGVWNYNWFARVLDEQVARMGGARGVVHWGEQTAASRLAQYWAEVRGLPSVGYPLDLALQGPAVWQMPNIKMLAEGKPKVLVVFPGGRRTADLVERAKVAKVFVVWAPGAPSC